MKIVMELLEQKWRTVADEELGRFLKEDGMFAFRRWYWVRELKKFGGSAASPLHVKKIKTAP